MDFTVEIVSRNIANTSNSEIIGIYIFFEAPNIGCRKTTCDVKKVTHYMYSCDRCCMGRKVMKMDDRDNATCQKSERKDMMEII